MKVVWDKQDISQADPTPHLQSLSTEELIPGETALMDIIRGNTRSRKNKEIICVHCGKFFINKKNHQKHVNRYHKEGATGRVAKGKKEKEYICIRCAKRYCNQKSLVNHMLECRGNLFNSTLRNISDKKTDDSSCEVEVCEIQTNPTLPGNPCKQLTALVSGAVEDTVVGGPQEVGDMMS